MKDLIYLKNQTKDSDFHGYTISCKNIFVNLARTEFIQSTIALSMSGKIMDTLFFRFIYFPQQHKKENKHKTALLDILAILKASQLTSWNRIVRVKGQPFFA